MCVKKRSINKVDDDDDDGMVDAFDTMADFLGISESQMKVSEVH